MPIVKVPQEGFTILVDLADSGVSQSLLTRAAPEEEWEAEVFRSLLRPGARVLDLGGNIGYYSLMARAGVGPNGNVVVFEPWPVSAALLERSAKENGFTNITVIEAAATDQPGLAGLHLSSRGWSDHSLVPGLPSSLPGDPIPVRAVRVDDELRARGMDLCFDVIKMDIEGSEPAALRGMEAVLDASPAAVLMTELWPVGIERLGSSVKELVEFLESKRFSTWHMDSERRAIEPVGSAASFAEDCRRLAAAAVDPKDPDDDWCTNLLCRRS